MTKDEAITQLRQSNISNEALMWLLDALKETPEQTNEPEPSNTPDPFEGAPEWARFRVAYKNGNEYWCQYEPIIADNRLFHKITKDGDSFTSLCPDRRLTYSDWKESMVERGKP